MPKQDNDALSRERNPFGVSIRSWAAFFLIVLGGCALAWAGEVMDLKELALAAMSFLFGKAAGEAGVRKEDALEEAKDEVKAEVTAEVHEDAKAVAEAVEDAVSEAKISDENKPTP